MLMERVAFTFFFTLITSGVDLNSIKLILLIRIIEQNYKTFDH